MRGFRITGFILALLAALTASQGVLLFLQTCTWGLMEIRESRETAPLVAKSIMGNGLGCEFCTAMDQAIQSEAGNESEPVFISGERNWILIIGAKRVVRVRNYPIAKIRAPLSLDSAQSVWADVEIPPIF